MLHFAENVIKLFDFINDNYKLLYTVILLPILQSFIKNKNV